MEQTATSRNTWLQRRGGGDVLTQQLPGSNFRQTPRDSEQGTQQQLGGVRSNYSNRPVARQMATPLNRRRDEEAATTSQSTYATTRHSTSYQSSQSLNNNQERIERIRAELDQFTNRAHPLRQASLLASRGSSSAAYSVPFPTVEPSRAADSASSHQRTRTTSAAVQPSEGGISTAAANLDRHMRLLQLERSELSKNGEFSRMGAGSAAGGSRSVPQTPPLSPIPSSSQTTRDYGHQTSRHQVSVLVDARRAVLASESDGADPLTETGAVMRRRESEARHMHNLDRADTIISDAADNAQLRKQATQHFMETQDLRTKLDKGIADKEALRNKMERMQVELNSEKRQRLDDNEVWEQKLAAADSNQQVRLDGMNARCKMSMEELRQVQENLEKERIKKERLASQVRQLEEFHRTAERTAEKATASREIAMAEASSMKEHLDAALEQTRRLNAKLAEVNQAAREDRAQLEEYQSHEIAMSQRHQETEREFVALEAKARDAVQQRDMLIKQEAALQESLNDTEADLENALKEKAELQATLKATAKDLENALREKVETVSGSAEARKGLERLLRESEAREEDLSAKLDLELAKRREQSSLGVSDALQRQTRSQVELKDLEIKRLERQVAALEATEETQSERLREQQMELSDQADLKADFEARIEAYEHKALEAERERGGARASVAAAATSAAAVEAKEEPRDSAREAALVAELEHLQAQLKQQQADLSAAKQHQRQQGLGAQLRELMEAVRGEGSASEDPVAFAAAVKEAEWHKRDSEELSESRKQVSKLREEARRRAGEVERLKEEIRALEEAPSSREAAPEGLQAAQDLAAAAARAQQLEGLLAAAEYREARLKEELHETAERAAAAAAAREGVTEAQAPTSGGTEGLLQHKCRQVASLQADLAAASKAAQAVQELHAQELKQQVAENKRQLEAVHLEGWAAARDPAKQREADEKVAAVQALLSKAEEEARGSAARASRAEGRLEEQEAAFQARLSKAEEEAQGSAARASRAEEQLREQEAKAKEATCRESGAAEALMTAEATMAYLRQALEKANDKAAAAEMSLEELQTQAEGLRAKVSEAETMASELSAAKSGLEQQLEGGRASEEKLRCTEEQLQEQAKLAEDRSREAEANKALLAEELQQARGALEETRGEAEAAKEARGEAEAALGAARDEVRRLEAESEWRAEELEALRTRERLLELECTSMQQVAAGPCPWEDYDDRLNREMFSGICHEQLAALKAHHAANGRTYRDEDVSEPVINLIGFRVRLQLWTQQNRSLEAEAAALRSRLGAAERELKEAVEARGDKEVKLERAEARAREEAGRARELERRFENSRENLLRAEVEKLKKYITGLEKAAETNAIDLRLREEERLTEAAEIKELKQQVLDLENDNSRLSGIDNFMDEMQAKVASLDADNDKQAAARRKAEARLGEAQRELAEARGELEEARRQGDASQEESAREAEERVAEAHREAEEARERLEAAEYEITELVRINDTIMRERDEALSTAASVTANQQQPNGHWPAFSPIRTPLPDPRVDVVPEQLLEECNSPGSWLLKDRQHSLGSPLRQSLSPSGLRPPQPRTGSARGGTPLNSGRRSNLLETSLNMESFATMGASHEDLQDASGFTSMAIEEGSHNEDTEVAEEEMAEPVDEQREGGHLTLSGNDHRSNQQEGALVQQQRQ